MGLVQYFVARNIQRAWGHINIKRESTNTRADCWLKSIAKYIDCEKVRDDMRETKVGQRKKKKVEEW